MRKEELRIIFLGNPEFAKYHLQKIVESGYNVVAAISAQDKPSGRGMKINSTPVTQYAREQNIPCLQPKNLKNQIFLDELASYKADIQIVIAFRMLPVLVWDMPPLGTYNLHASLLPQYRGAAPINWAIINGESITGVSTFKLKHEIDTGNLLVQKECEINDEDNAGSLHDKLMHLGATAMLETLDQIVSNTVTELPQKNNSNLKTAPKLFTDNTKINWNKNGIEIINFIRGLCPYPVAFTNLGVENLKVYAGQFIKENHNLAAGIFSSDNKSFLKVTCIDGWINLTEIKLQGKRKMFVKDFLNGYDISHLELAS